MERILSVSLQVNGQRVGRGPLPPFTLSTIPNTTWRDAASGSTVVKMTMREHSFSLALRRADLTV